MGHALFGSLAHLNPMMRARVSEVSDELGYSSPAQIFQTFRNHFCMPPKVYQRTHAPRANVPHTRPQ
jgi:AraC-like DNA-binding protein